MHGKVSEALVQLVPTHGHFRLDLLLEVFSHSTFILPNLH